ncbi:hypothetical protein PPH41_07440 [Burkholderia gladioli]|nr:hypothetical protein [Burkholderia gladioli]
MQLPDHEDLHGCVKVILGDILECSIVDILKLPFGSRIHARWDTIICGERRTIRRSFQDDPERGPARTQLEEWRPAIRSAFESEERARMKYGVTLCMPLISGPGNVIRAIEAEMKRIEARTGSTLFDAGTSEACQRIRKVIAAATTPDSNPSSGAKSTPFGPTNVREPMPYIMPAVVRVCLISDAECSQGCGDGPCKRGDEGGAA